jgi:hypothetical protein
MANTMQAGAVVIKITGVDKAFLDSLKRCQAGFTGFTAYVRDASVTFAALDASLRRYLFAPLKAATLEFSSFGDNVAKMSRRVGIGAHDLSLLGFAAEQSGSNLTDLGNGMRFFNRNLAAATQGNKSALETFGRLGINFDQLQTLSKKDQFLTVAEAIRQLGDEALQTDAAMKVFGKGGTALLPMFQEGIGGIRDLMAEAEFNGIGISDADAAKAEVLNDSIGRISQSLQGLRTTIAAALSGPVTELLDGCTRLIRWFREWINTNPSLARSILYVGSAAAIAAAGFSGWRFVVPIFKLLSGAANVFKGALLSAFSFFLSPPSASVKSVGAALLRVFTAPLGSAKIFGTFLQRNFIATLLLAQGLAGKTQTMLLRAFCNPLGAIRSVGAALLRVAYYAVMFINPWALIRLAVMGAVSAILYFTGAGTKLMQWFGGFGEKIKATFTSAFGDITALVQEGRILDAVKLLWLKVQLLFEEGKLAIMNKCNEIVAAVSEPFMAIYDAVMSVVQPVFEWICTAAGAAAQYVVDAWNSSMGWLVDMFGEWWTHIKEGWDALMNDTGAVIVGTWWSIATGVNSAWAWMQTQWNNLLTGMQKTCLYIMKGIIDAFTMVVRTLDFTGTMQGLVNTANAKIDQMIDGVTARGNVKNEQIEQVRKDRQAYWDDMAMKSLNKVDAAKKNAPKTNDRIDMLKMQIEELKKPGTQSSKKAQQITNTAQQIATGGASSIVNGTMNKADIKGGALAYMASEKDHSEDIADNTGQMVDQMKELNSIVRRGGGMVYA